MLTPEQIQQYRSQYSLDKPAAKTDSSGAPDRSSELESRIANIHAAASGKTQAPTPPAEVHKPGLLENVANVGLGAVKGAVSTFKGAADLGQKIFDPITDTLTGTKSKGQNTNIIPPKAYTATNTAQKFGKGVEQLAELVTPIGLETKGANLVTKIAKGALEFGGKTAVQSGGDPKQTAIAAATGGAGEVLALGVDKLLEKVPANAWSAILKRTPNQVAKNPSLPAQAADTAMVGTRHQIVAQSKNNIQQIEVALDQLLSGSKEKIGTLKIAPYLDELRNSYKNIPGEQGSVETINNVMKDLLKEKTMTPLQMNQMKRDIYGLIEKSYGKGILEVPAKTEAQKQIARGLKTEIERVIPEAKTLNEQQAVYIQIRNALNKLAARTEGKGIAGTGVGLYDLMTGGLAEAAGIATGHPLLGLGTVAAKKTMESAPVLSSVAKLAKYFDSLSPTKKLIFKASMDALAVKGATSVGQ